MYDKCFFCAEEIEGKKTKEHIFADSLLGKLGIKNEILSAGFSDKEYSRIKVPAHEICNSTFGSQYESKIIDLLDNLETLYDEIEMQESNIVQELTPSDSKGSLLTTWLLKLYYGFHYYDYLFRYEDNIEMKEISRKVIESENFELVRKAYKINKGFNLPSSLFIYKGINTDFDLRTLVIPQCIMLKIREYTFVLCIGDGFLVKSYINKDQMNNFKTDLINTEKKANGYPSHLNFLSEFIAHQICIKKSPSFIFNDEKLVNLSFNTLVDNPEEYYKLDYKEVGRIRDEVFKKLNSHV